MRALVNASFTTHPINENNNQTIAAHTFYFVRFSAGIHQVSYWAIILSII